MKIMIKHIFLMACLLSVTGSGIAEKSLILQSTTSTANSGLYDYLLPIFEKDSGIKVNVVAVGTGQAIKNAQNCDGDVLLVHAKAAEEKFIAEGYGLERFDVMYNDFIFVGPPDDPANIRSVRLAANGLLKIAESRSIFLSRGDNSGTHKKELSLWKSAGVDPVMSSGAWYRETGSGMGATLNVAVEMNAYAMTDRGTWIGFGNKQDFDILLSGDNDLFNQYGVMMVNPERCNKMNMQSAKKFTEWILSDKGQSLIANYQLQGQQLFFPNAE
ncbi:MAG: solute-binding protein [Gammaproteobacteria bacterium]|nr:solute-binding protein [Gammaproteobacteria bacterium]